MPRFIAANGSRILPVRSLIALIRGNTLSDSNQTFAFCCHFQLTVLRASPSKVPGKRNYQQLALEIHPAYWSGGGVIVR